MGDEFFQFRDAGCNACLFVFRFIVFAVFRKVAVGTCLRKALLDFFGLFALEIGQFINSRLIAFFGILGGLVVHGADYLT